MDDFCHFYLLPPLRLLAVPTDPTKHGKTSDLLTLTSSFWNTSTRSAKFPLNLTNRPYIRNSRIPHITPYGKVPLPHALFSVAKELLEGPGGVVIQTGEEMAEPQHAFLRGEGDWHQATEKTALHAETVLSAVLVVGVQDLVWNPGHPVRVQSADARL